MTLDQAKSIVTRYRDQIEVVAFGAVLLAMGSWIGLSAFRARATLAKDAAVLQAEVSRNDRWRSEFRPPSVSELERWRQAEAALRRLGVRPEERITIAQVVARTGEETGLDEIRVRFVPADTTGGFAPVEQVGKHQFRAAPYRLVITGRGSYDAFVRLVGSLPPSVSVQELSSSRKPSGIVHNIVLSVIESVESNGPGSTAIRPGGDGAARGARRGTRISPGD